MNREALKVVTPAQSTPRAAGSRDSAIFMNVSAIAAIPIGTFRAKTDCQPIPSVRAPPTNGPIATATPIVAPYRPVAIPSSLPLNSCAISASETANMIAPPTPCTARETLSQVGSGASAATPDATVKITSPQANTRLRPSRSASEPATRTNAASVSVYASTTHWRSVNEASRSSLMLGSAVFTTVMSSSSMKTATLTTASVTHLRAIWSTS